MEPGGFESLSRHHHCVLMKGRNLWAAIPIHRKGFPAEFHQARIYFDYNHHQ